MLLARPPRDGAVRLRSGSPSFRNRSASPGDPAPVDATLLHAVNGFAVHHDGFEDAVSRYEAFSQALFLGLVLLLVAVGGEGGVLRRAGVAAGLGAALALACAQVVVRLVDRPRPFVADPGGVHLFGHHAADPGFPSDHATAAFAIATAVALRDRRLGAAFFALAFVLAAGRVALGLHYPSDVLAGAALGSACSLALYAPAPRALVDGLADTAGLLLPARRGWTLGP
jgi:undecaprenyl-diphosphatase